VPVGGLLQLVCHIQHSGFGEIIADDLQADRAAVVAQANRNAHARQTGQIHRQRVDVGQVHCHRIIGFFAQIPGGGRCHRTHDHVALLEGFDEVLRNQAPQLLCLDVVGVVVAVRQYVSAYQNPAFDLGAKTFGTGSLVHVVQVAVFGGAMTVTYTVVTAEVGRGFGRGNHIVGGNRQLAVGQADFNHLRAEFLVFGDGGIDTHRHVAGQAFTEKFARQADLQAVQRFVQIAAIVFLGAIQAGRVTLVETGHGIQQQRAVFRRTSHRAGLIQAGGVGDHAVTRHHAVSRLDAADAAERCRLTDRAAGVGAGGRWCQPRGHCRSRAAGAAARYGVLIPRVFHRAEKRVFVGRAHSEFVHVQLAENHRAGRIELADHVCIVRCDKVVEHLRAAGSAPAVGSENVFVRNRNACQRAGIAGCTLGIGCLCLCQRQSRVYSDVGVQLRIQFGDAVEVELGQFDAGNLLGCQGSG
jgi:hypothetical protein